MSAMVIIKVLLWSLIDGGIYKLGDAEILMIIDEKFF